MARPVDPNAQFRIKTHTSNGHTYASTQPPILDPLTGVKKYRHVHWGTLDENLKFTPNSPFYEATPEERAKLIFPDNWDMSLAEKFTGLKNHEWPNFCSNCMNRLYGDVWLLENIANITGIRQDLLTVFDNNYEIVDDIVTLAIFPYLTQFNYNRIADWQEIVKAPSQRRLTPYIVTRITQYITEQHRIELLGLRAARLEIDELCAIDSTTRSAYGDCLVDIRWGKNKDMLPLKQTMEVVVYTLSSHMPVYYRTFPGNMNDARSLDIILKDLEQAGFKDLVLVTDRGYETVNNLNKFILRGQSIVMCTKTSNKEVANIIMELGDIGTRPETMKVDHDTDIYYKQYDIDHEIKGADSTIKSSNKLKLNLFFNSFNRAKDQLVLDKEKSNQEDELNELFKNKTEVDARTIKNEFCYYTVTINPKTRTIESFDIDKQKVSKAIKASGFFSIMTHGIDFDAMKTYHTYHLRDEQEKYFQQMKDQMGSDRQRNSSEDGKTGRLFILFVSLILGSYVRHIWKSTELKKLFPSSLAILDAMRPIRCIEQPNMEKLITPFVGNQLDICKEFGIKVPDGCAPTYPRKELKNKRGRSCKKYFQKG
ncbi:MAG: transposase [Deltaproteobacteria bacterium]|jgi:transposase|nr:transposase [Deltaproteobacteria bacterium]